MQRFVQYSSVNIQLLVDLEWHEQTDDCVTNLEDSVLKLCNVVDGDAGWLKGDVEI